MMRALLAVFIMVLSGSCFAYPNHKYPNSSNFVFQVVQGDRAHDDKSDYYSEDLYNVRYLGNHWYEDQRYYYYYDDFDPAIYQMNIHTR
ncbi:MAG: hypothetical protein AB7V32_10770 [Candidatus Berkiella sp.]